MTLADDLESADRGNAQLTRRVQAAVGGKGELTTSLEAIVLEITRRPWVWVLARTAPDTFVATARGQAGIARTPELALCSLLVRLEGGG